MLLHHNAKVYAFIANKLYKEKFSFDASIDKKTISDIFNLFVEYGSLDDALNDSRHRKLPAIKYYEKIRNKYIKETLEEELQSYLKVFSEQEKQYLLTQCQNINSDVLSDKIKSLNICIEKAQEMYKFHPSGEIAEELKEKYKGHKYFT